MSPVTVTGTVHGTPITIFTSTPIQTILAQQVLSAAMNTTSALVTGAGGFLTQPTTVDISETGSVLTGNSSVTSAQVILDGQNGSYVTAGTTLSTVVAGDETNSSITNNNPQGGLIAVTGAGGNVLNGASGANQFITGVDGPDVVFLDGAANTLTSNGNDAVLVGGPSTITAAASGGDNVVLTSGTVLSFINSSTALISSVTGAANGQIVLAGPGRTSVSSGVGPESFFIDTSAGSVTLNGGLQANNTFEFLKNADVGTANDLVNNFAAGDAVLIHGYAGYTIAPAPGDPFGSVLTLSDHSQVTFSNVSVATLQQTIKVV